MRKRRGWGIGAAVLVSLGISTAGAADTKGGAADSPPADTSSSGWLPSWFGSKDKPPVKLDKPSNARADASAAKDKKKDEPPSTGRDAVSQTATERAKYLRRLKVCDRLRGIAQDTNDAELERMVDQLEERAYAVFLQRTGVPNTASTFESDEKTLEKHLPLGATPSKSQSAGTASAQNNPGQSGRIREN